MSFRYFTRREARRLGVSGWVRNRADGAVEVEAAGSASALAELVAALERGPAGARVTGVREEPFTGAADWSGFDIVY